MWEEMLGYSIKQYHSSQKFRKRQVSITNGVKRHHDLDQNLMSQNRQSLSPPSPLLDFSPIPYAILACYALS
jgi:hypothetical protein